MLTDIFAFRYADKQIWSEYTDRERRLIVQSFNLAQELFPYYNDEGKENPIGKMFWKNLHGRIANELGVKYLSQPAYSYNQTFQGKQTTVSGTWPWITICETWVFANPVNINQIDTFIKERISLVEVVFRMKEAKVKEANDRLQDDIGRAQQQQNIPSAIGGGIRVPGSRIDSIRAWNKSMNDQFRQAVQELNTRFRQAGCNLHYHNGFVQISKDNLIADEIEEPFWHLVSSAEWGNVDSDMKEAIDRRDSSGANPAFYAVRALESTIKIISDKKGWTHGSEKGAHNYIENLAKKSSSFIEAWEADALKLIFTKIRNPLGHGPGSAPMPKLSPPQTDWAIETCMSWIKNLINRL